QQYPEKTTARFEKSMPISLTDFVQKHKTKIAKNGENDSASEENYNNIQKKQQQDSRKACP
ncbi:hypothetical protein, partial [Phocaeicola sp.]|uniref:hypothetical protein n=1 Tax=Phocaeicola sp. TaxID=2773926 RepID=UPI003AB23A97